MALQLKIAELYADLVVRRKNFDAQMTSVKNKLDGLKVPKIDLAVDASKAHARLDALIAKLKKVQSQASIKMGVGAGGIGGGSGGGGRGPVYGPQLPSGGDFVGLGVVQMAGIKYQDQLRAQQAKTAAAVQRAADAQIAADVRVQAAHQRTVAAQTRNATRAYQQQVAAANRAAAQQIAAAQRVANAQAAASRAHRQQFAGGVAMGLGFPPMAATPFGAGGMAVGMAASAGISAIVGAISATTDGLKASAATAIDLEAKFAEIRRVAGLSADETARLKRELIDISKVQPGVTIDDLIQMADIGGRMGLQGGALKGFASDLAMVKNAVSGMETEDLANNMGRVLGVFKLGPEYVRGFGSALTAMDNATKASASDILQITQGLSGTAAAIGLTLPQVVALSAALRDAGLSNAVASSSFSQIFRKMATEMDDFARVAQVDANAMADAYRRDPMEALSLLMKGLAKAGDSLEKQEMLKELGLDGVRASGAVLQLAQVFDKLAAMISKANGEFTTLKSLAEADSLKGDTTLAALTKLGNATVDLADKVGSILSPGIKGITNDLTAMTRAADDSAGALINVAANSTGKWLDVAAMMMGQMPIFGGTAAMMFGTMPAPITTPPKGPELPVKDAAAFIPGLGAAIEATPPKPKFDPKALTMDGIQDAIKKKLDATRKANSGMNIAGLLLGGITGNSGMALSAADRLAGGSLGDALGATQSALNGSGGLGGMIAKSLGGAATDRLSASVGLSGADFGRQQQQQILDTVAKDQLVETKSIGQTLREIRDQLKQAKGNAVNALLGPG